MTLDARLDKLQPPTEAANAALDGNLDAFLTNNAPLDEPMPVTTQAEEPVQVAGIGSGMKSLVGKLIPKQIQKAPKLDRPVYDGSVEKLITPKVAADIAVKAEDVAAIPLTGKPPEELFNWMRTGLTGEQDQFIEGAARAAGVTRPTRVAHKEILDDLREAGFTEKDIAWTTSYADNKKMMRQVAMSREAMVSTAKIWQGLSRELEVNPSPELAIKFHQTGVLLGQLTRGVKNLTTDTARSLGIMRANPMGDTAAIESVLADAGGIDNMIALAGKVSKLDLTNPANLARAANLADVSMFSKLKNIWMSTYISGLLYWPVTHTKNMGGNAIFAAIQVPERATASLIGKARNALLPGGEDAIEMDEAVALVRGMMAGQVQSFRAAAKGFVNNAPSTPGSKITDTGGGANISDFGDYLGVGGNIGRAMNWYGRAVTLSGRALLAEDEYFKTNGYFTELFARASRGGAAARREALAAGKSVDEAAQIELARAGEIINDPPHDINAAAWDTARYLTFTDPLQHGTVGKHVQDIASSNVVVRTFVPFVRTPINLMAAGLERTPFAPFTQRFQDGWAAGGIQRDMALAKVAVGTSVLGTGAYLGAIGRITGGGPGDPGQREALINSNWQPYAFVFYKGETDAGTRKQMEKFGRVTQWGDKVTWTFSGIEPLGSILSMGANYAEYARWNDNVSEVEAVGYGMSFGLAQYMSELPYLQGMAQAVEMMTGNAGGRITPETVRNFVTGISKTATSFAIGGSPAGAGSAAQAGVERLMSPSASATRHPEMTQDPGLRGVMEAFDRYRSRVPGLSSSIPNLTNRWAEPKQYGEGELYETVSPIRVKQGNQKPVDKLWLDYDLPRGQPSRQITWTGREDMVGIHVTLNEEQFNDLKRIYAWEIKDNGLNVQDALVASTRDPAFKKMSLPSQQAWLLKIDNAFMSAARIKFVNQSRFAPMLQAEFERKKLLADQYGLYSDELR